MTVTTAAVLPFAIGLALGALFGAVFAWLWTRGEVARLAERLRAREDVETRLRSGVAGLAAEVAQASGGAMVERARAELQAALAAAERGRDGDRDDLRRLVDPVAATLDRLGEEVRRLEERREGAYQGLRQELELLRDAQTRLLTVTIDLKRALKASGVRGRWGELQLRRVVEMAGMVEHVDFAEQPSVAGQRPDMIVHLPDGGRLPVDAKAPMDAYLAAAEAPDAASRRAALAAHRKALRQRIAELGERRYEESVEAGPGFVVLFLPGEAALAAAFEEDPGILDHALAHRVLPASPVTLLALLKTVAFGWRQHRVAEDARRLVDLGAELHRRLERFLDPLAKLGRALDTTVRAYNTTLGTLEHRLLPAARRLADTPVTAPPTVDVAPRVPVGVEDHPSDHSAHS